MKNIDLGDEIKSVFDPGGEIQQMLSISKCFSDQLDDMNQVGTFLNNLHSGRKYASAIFRRYRFFLN